eukprot:7548058-Heterocapsa_arctica.AAC.1
MKNNLVEAVAAENELKKGEVMKVLNSLAAVAAEEVKKSKFVISVRTKPPTNENTKMEELTIKDE